MGGVECEEHELDVSWSELVQPEHREVGRIECGRHALDVPRSRVVQPEYREVGRVECERYERDVFGSVLNEPSLCTPRSTATVPAVVQAELENRALMLAAARATIEHARLHLHNRSPAFNLSVFRS